MTDCTDSGATPEETQSLPQEEATGSSTTPERERRRARITEPSQDELDALPADRRLEFINQQRQQRHQTLNSVGILFGVLFTAASLIATALTLRIGQEEVRNAREGLRSAQEGQITDRYTKAIEQLGSGKPEVRLGGIYALERLMTDSARDHRTILEVFASYVRVHSQDDPPAGSDKTRLSVDVQAALTVIGNRERARAEDFHFDLSAVDFHDKNLSYSNLTAANLSGANLSGARLEGLDLRSVDLHGVDLSGANLTGANLNSVDLRGVDLYDANLTSTNLTSTNLTGTNMTSADLRGANLTSTLLFKANLTNANLFDAELESANLGGVVLRGVDLRAANLTGVNLTGVNLRDANLTSAEIRDAILTGADLRDTNLRSANLIRTNLRDADLRGANLADVDLTSAELQGADVRGVVGMSAEEIRYGADTDSATRF